MTPCFGRETIRSRDKSRSQFNDKTSSLNEKNIGKQYGKKEHKWISRHFELLRAAAVSCYFFNSLFHLFFIFTMWLKTHRRVGLVNSFHPTLRPRTLVSLNKRTRRQQERHLRMQLGVSRFVFIPRLFQVVWLAKCFLTILELYWWSGLEMEIRN